MSGTPDEFRPGQGGGAMKAITSRENPQFKELRMLLSAPRRQRETGWAVLEGPHLVAAALDHGVLPDLVVMSESALANAEIEALLARIDTVEVLCLPDALFRGLSELATPVGILARIAIPAGIGVLPDGDCLLLDAVQDAGNVGTLLRTAAAAGIRDILLGPGCAGAWTSRVLRAGQGAHFSLAIREQVDLAGFMRSYVGETVAAVAHGGELLYDLEYLAPTAWLFGSEGGGIAPELLALVRQHVTIPLAAGNESLNVAAATAVCLFEMRRQRRMKKVDAGGMAAN